MVRHIGTAIIVVLSSGGLHEFLRLPSIPQEVIRYTSRHHCLGRPDCRLLSKHVGKYLDDMLVALPRCCTVLLTVTSLQRMGTSGHFTLVKGHHCLYSVIFASYMQSMGFKWVLTNG